MKEIENDDLKRELMESSGYKDCFSIDVLNDTGLLHFSAGEFIIEEATQPCNLFYLARGRAKLYATSPNGRISLIDFFSESCFIGEIELIDIKHEPRAVKAIEDCWCLTLPIASYRNKLLNDTVFLSHLCLFLSRKNYRNIVSLTQNQSFPLINRLAAFILFTQYGNIYKEKHTQAAEYMGVSYRHLLYVIAQLTREGILEKNKLGYEIKSYDKLKTLVREMDPDNKFLSL